MPSVLKNLYHRLPPPLRLRIKRSLAPLTRLVKHGVLIAQDARVPVRVAGDDRLRVVFIGRDLSLGYLTQSFFGRVVKPESAGNVLAWKVPALVEAWRAKAHFIVISLHDFWCAGALERETLFLPRFLTQLMDLPASAADVRASIHSKSARDDLRRIRKFGYTLEIVRAGAGPQDRDHDIARQFYEEFHKPMVDNRHGDLAESQRYEDFLDYFEEGELLLVRQKGRPVAGVVCRREGDEYKLMIAGLYRADPELLRNGAMAAWYYFSILRAVELGCRRLNYGRSRPFIHDGILQFKNKWATALEPNFEVERDSRLALGLPGPAAQNWLTANPFITRARGVYVSLIFIGDSNPPDVEAFERLLHRARIAGTAAICLVALSGDRPELAETAAAFGTKEKAPILVVPFSAGGALDPIAFTAAIRKALRAALP